MKPQPATFHAARLRHTTHVATWLAACLSLAAWCLWPGNHSRSTDRDPSVAQTRAIEAIRPGDWVLARDDATGQLAPRRVLDTFQRVSDHLRIVEVAHADGRRQTFHTTNEHPFWVEAKGWTQAADLLPGDPLHPLDGTPATVHSTHYESHPDGIAVHNLKVDTDHTYFALADDANNPILVHNANCPPEMGPNTYLPGSFSIRDWSGYPDGVPRATGPFRLLTGEEYRAARKAANVANDALRRADQGKYVGKQIHEIHPVKFDGSPSDPDNKIALTPTTHRELNAWWYRLQRRLE